MKNIILHLFLVLLCRNLVIAQSNYVQLADMSGYNTGTGNIATLADEANAALPEIYRSFKVIDFGYYIHNGEQGLTEEIMANAETQAASESPYFLLVGKESNPEGVLNRFTVKLKIPLVTNCLSQEDVDIKAQELENLLNNENTGPTTYITNLAKATADLRDYFRYMTDSCCYAGISGFTGEMCSGIYCGNKGDNIVAKLKFPSNILSQYNLEAYVNDNHLQCEIYNVVQENGGFGIPKALAIARATLLAHKIEKSLYDNRINNRGSGFDPEFLLNNSGLSAHIYDYEKNKSKYNDLCLQLYNKAKSGNARFLVLSFSNFASSIFQQVVQSITSSIVGTFQNIVTLVSTPEGRILLAHLLGPIILDVVLEMGGYGLFVDMKDIILEFTQPVINYITVLISIVSLIANFIPLTKLATAMTGFMIYAKAGIDLMQEVLKNNFAVKFILKKLDAGYELVKISGEFCIKKGSDVRKCTSFLGCFTKNTPVLMVSNRSQLQAENEAIRDGFIDYEPSQAWLGLYKSLKSTGYSLALAALPLFTPVPIQDVQLFDYAVAHKSVNSSYGLTASNDDTFIIGKDPYTSDQQRSRDQYEINDNDWNEVAFEEVNGTSTCKLALHNDWITNHDYTVDGIINMNLPEQGISGPFRITSIKHIIPQKKPVDEDPNDDYEYKPVTGLFIHHSDQVHNINFSNNETLGVTAPHPIFSTTHNDWRLAGDLEVGVKVLTYHGEVTVTNTEKKAGSEAVYNIEVKDLHNFLVGDVGVVVHNGCSWLKNFITFNKQQIKTHYAKPNHASAFGLPPNYNTVNGDKWEEVMKNFVASDGKRHFPEINYRDQFKGVLVMEESTGLMVLMKESGEFVTAYKLGANQISDIINKNYLY